MAIPLKAQRKMAYAVALQSVESLIMMTPTGPIRDKLTEINIELMTAAQDQLALDEAAA